MTSPCTRVGHTLTSCKLVLTYTLPPTLICVHLLRCMQHSFKTSIFSDSNSNDQKSITVFFSIRLRSSSMIKHNTNIHGIQSTCIHTIIWSVQPTCCKNTYNKTHTQRLAECKNSTHNKHKHSNWGRNDQS